MDPLVAKSKEIFPDADDKELEAMIGAVRQTSPEAPDDQILQIAAKVKEQQDQSQTARSYVKDKYGIAERNKIVEQNAEESSGGNGAAALAALGAGLAGRDATSAGQAVLSSQKANRDSRLANFDKSRDLAVEERDSATKLAAAAAKKDPNSELSKAMQQMAVEDYGMDPATAAKIPAEILEARLPGLKYKAERGDKAKDLAFKEKELGLKTQIANNKQSDTDAKSETKLSEGQKAVDKDYAKQYNNFSSKGKVNAASSISKLEAIADEMDKDQGFGESGGGRIAAELPDWARSRDAIRRRDQARNAANSTLKELFGGQLSDAERESAAKEYYNDALDNKANAKILREKIAQLKDSQTSEEQKARYYEENGTLQGFKYQAPGENVETKVVQGTMYRKVPGGWEEVDKNAQVSK